MGPHSTYAAQYSAYKRFFKGESGNGTFGHVVSLVAMAGIDSVNNSNREEREEPVDPRRLQGEAGKLLRQALLMVFATAALPSSSAHAHAPDPEMHLAKDIRDKEAKRDKEVTRHIHGDPNALRGVNNRDTRMTIEHAAGEFNDEIAKHLNALQPMVMEFDARSRKFLNDYDAARKKAGEPVQASSSERNTELIKARSALQSLMGVGRFIESIYVNEMTQIDHRVMSTGNKVIDSRIIASDPRLRSRLHHFNDALVAFMACEQSVRVEVFHEMFAKEAEWIDDWKRIKKAFERDGDSQI